ncbi:sugar O-acyltransferase (sialic acid O-acetyltransferase NeuD family) [Chitinophaga sp. W3I9]|uniref:PglD-related sugar-binding protein n=1 Tax=unclassified Chitinophaga TaxID=2619133 RepID=UPI003D25FE6B
MESCLIYGAGGHANVLADLVMLSGGSVPVMFTDQATGESSRVQAYQPSLFPEVPLVLGIGNNEVRRHLSEKVSHRFTALVHPAAYVAGNAVVGEGSVVLAKAVVQANSIIGNHSIINAGAVVDHDAVIGDYVHIAGNAYIGGGAVIGNGALIGQGAVIMRNTVIAQGDVVPPLTVVGD